MTVPAPDHALVHFHLEADRTALVLHPAHIAVLQLWFDVIEVEDNWVTLTAIDARMRHEEFVHQSVIHT